MLFPINACTAHTIKSITEKRVSLPLSSSSSSSTTTPVTMNPCFGIRLLRSDTIPSIPIGETNEETSELIKVLLRQDLANYKCEDYLIYSSSCTTTKTGADGDSAVAACTDTEFDVDRSCREKMIEWCYRVCDCGIFPCQREMVAIAISYLDRYMQSIQSNCTRSTFKLAAVTSFYLATKIMTNMQIRIESLVELGRGSFSGDDILQMEKLLIEKLRWYMNPPTIQSMIRHLFTLLPSSIQKENVFQRAMFFAELAVYEYQFVTKDRLTLAIACTLNAVTTISEKSSAVVCGLATISSQINMMKCNTAVDAVSDDEYEMCLNDIQTRLWYLYSCSPQISDDSETNVIPKRVLSTLTLNVDNFHNTVATTTANTTCANTSNDPLTTNSTHNSPITVLGTEE